MSRTVRGSLSGGQDDEGSSKKRKNVERKPTFLSFFKVKFYTFFFKKKMKIKKSSKNCIKEPPVSYRITDKPVSRQK